MKKYFAKKQWMYNYEITVTEYKKDTLKIDVTNHQWDSHDYAFVKKSNQTLDGIYSYSDEASNYVKCACKVANVFCE